MEPISKNAYILYEHEVSSTLAEGNVTYAAEQVPFSGDGWRGAVSDPQPSFTFVFRHIVNVAAFRSGFAHLARSFRTRIFAALHKSMFFCVSRIQTHNVAALKMDFSMNGYSWQTYSEDGLEKVKPPSDPR